MNMIVSPTPNVPQKSWFKKPENKTATGFAVVLGGAGLYGLYQILPFILSMLVDTVHIVLLATFLFAFGYVVLSDRFRKFFQFLYMSVMRKLTSLFVEVDPIGILKNKLSLMEERQVTLNEQVGALKGSVTRLESIIVTNNRDAEKALELAEEAKRQLANAKDAAKAQYLTAQKNNCAARAVRLSESNDNYKQLTVVLNGLYQRLIRISIDCQAYIEDKKDVIKMEDQRRKSLKSAFGAYHSALGVLKGSPIENEMEDMAMQFLAEDADRMLGSMADFERITEDVLGSMDLERGVVGTKAMKALEAYEQKKFGPIGGGTVVPARQPVPVERVVEKAKDANEDYGTYFK